MRQTNGLAMFRDKTGTLMIDRIVPRVGRIKRASGTNDPAVFAAILRGMLALQDRHDWETLRALKNGDIAPAAIATTSREVPMDRDALKLYVIHRPTSHELKIGLSRNVKERLAMLQLANGEPLFLLASCPATPGFEREIHGRFAKYRKLGEWFVDATEVLTWAASVDGEIHA